MSQILAVNGSLDRQASSLAGGASAMETGLIKIDHRDPKCGFQVSMCAGGQTIERAWEKRRVGPNTD